MSDHANLFELHGYQSQEPQNVQGQYVKRVCRPGQKTSLEAIKAGEL
jgi:hypothetical protein